MVETHPFDCEQLIAYAAGELDAATAEAVEKHLHGCAECTRLVRHYRLIRSIVREDDTQAPPAATLARAQALFRPRKRSWVLPVLRPLLSGRPLARATLLAAFILAIALAFGAAQAVAQQTKCALPGDTLYPVKTAIEDAHVAITLDSASKVQVQMSTAETRVTEIETLVSLGRYDLVPSAAKDFEGHIQDATAALGQAAQADPQKKVELAQKVETDLVQYTEALTSLQQTTPTQIKPAIEHAVQVSDAVQTNVREQLAAPASATPVPSPSAIPPATLTPSATDTSLPPATDTPLPTNTPLPPPTSTPLPVPTSTPERPPTNTPLPPPTNTPLPSPTSTPLPTATSTPVPPPTSTPAPSTTATPLPPATSTPLAATATATPASTAIPAATTEPVTRLTAVPSTPTSILLPSSTPAPPSTSTPAPLGTGTPAAVATGTPAVLILNTPVLPTITPDVVTVTVVASPTLAPRSEEITPVGLMWDVTRIEPNGSNGLTATSGWATEANGSSAGEIIRADTPHGGPVSSPDSPACGSFGLWCARGLMPILFSTCLASGGFALGMFAALRRPGSEQSL